MFRRLDRTIGLSLGVVIGGWALAGGCRSGTQPPVPEGALAFRIENYTSSQADVTIDVVSASVDAGDTSGLSTGTNIEATSDAKSTAKPRGTVLQALTTAATVRVPAARLSEGVLQCGDGITIRASVGGASSPVMLEGDGAGTSGFDAGSIGPDGERLLFFNRDYRCSDTIVIQITDDAGSAGAAGRGRVRIYSSAEPIPDPDFSTVPLADDDDEPDTPESVSTRLRVVNRTGSLVEATFVLGGTLVSDGSSGTGGSTITVRVPAGDESSGTAACASRLSVAAFVITQTVGADGVTEGSIETVLTGAGTGTPGFDEGSVGTDYTRQLELGTHFECNVTVTVTIEDDGIGLDAEGNPVFSLGAGVVSVGS